MKSFFKKFFQQKKELKENSLQSEISPREVNSQLTAFKAERKQLLVKHIKIQMDKAKLNSQLIPREFVRNCERLFKHHLNDILEKVVKCEFNKITQNFVCQDKESKVYMTVFIVPWTTEETIYKLSAASDEPPYGYIDVLTKIFNNWPSPDLTHFFHVYLCLGENILQMHTAMGDYGGFPKARRDFTAYPVDLLNNEERRIIGL